MRKYFNFLLSIMLLILMTTSFSTVSAIPFKNSEDIVAKYGLLEKNFLEDLINSEWVHVNVSTDLIDTSTIQMENWYHLKDGLTFEVFEWTMINDGQMEYYQEGMLRDGIWFNITYMQKGFASSSEFELDLTSGFGEKLLAISADGGLIHMEEIDFNGLPAYMFSYFTKDDVSKEIGSFERRIYFERSSGVPLGSEIYQNNIDGSIVLIKRAIFTIELEAEPPNQRLEEIRDYIKEKQSSFQWFNEFESDSGSKTWYQTTYRAENVVVSGLTIKSYKTALPYDTFWKGGMYTSTPYTILQQVGAEWFSFQERCGASIYNTYISTTSDILTGRVHWYKPTGIAYYYYDDCAIDHKVFVNGSHYAKYNYTVMLPSPNFTIWMPVP